VNATVERPQRTTVSTAQESSKCDHEATVSRSSSSSSSSRKRKRKRNTDTENSLEKRRLFYGDLQLLVSLSAGQPFTELDVGKANEAAARPLTVQRQASLVSSVEAEGFHKSERPLRTPVQQWAPASVYREGRVRKSSARRSRVGDVVVMHGHTVHRAPAYQSQTLRTLLFVPFQPRHLSRRALSAPAQVTDVSMACCVEDERGALRSLSLLADSVIADEREEKLVLQHYWTSMR